MIPLHLLSVAVVCRPLSAFTIIPSFVNPIPGHAFQPHHLPRQHRVAPFESSQSQTVSVSASASASAANDEYNFDDGDDESLLKVVKRDQLEGLCDQLNLSKKGTKGELLARLRGHSQEKARSDRDRHLSRVERVQKGMDEEGDGKARHTILENFNGDTDNDDDDADDDGFFYFSIPGANDDSNNKTKTNTNANALSKVSKVSIDTADVGKTQTYITAPPPPPNVKPNADGERTVTIFSSTDQNDLTGVVAAHSSATGNTDANTLRSNSYNPTSGSTAEKPQTTLAGGPFGDQSGSIKRKASEKEMDDAVEVITELVQNLLAITGAPGFQDDVMSMEKEDTTVSGDTDTDTDTTNREGSNIFATAANLGFIGFDPSRVPTSILTENSNVLRVANGEALHKVLNDFEMRSIGIDGRAGDDTDRGGGHYLEVRKVTTFLEGFRKAEVRKVARETATMLLDKLVSDGVKGLDEMLMTMTKGSDDSSDAGELNDSLVLYLEDAIRQQEKKTGKKIGVQGIKNSWTEMATDRGNNIAEDDFSNLWNVTTGEDGETIETLNPNDPSVKQTLESELKSSSKRTVPPATSVLPVEPAEQLLILLTLLKERVKAEAIFSNDERGRNLRVLAYCIHAGTEKDRETIIMDHFGSSLDRLDSFSELLTSSIDYAESTSHQLQPSKSAPLDVRLLNSIKGTVEDIKESQAWKASGISTQEQNRIPS